MADDTPPTAPMKPQDTVIYILGELGGKMSSLSDSVNSSATAQSAVNAANELEHQKFRETLGSHATQIAILTDGKKVQQENRLTRWQLIGLWIGAPSGLASLIAVLTFAFSQKN